MARAEGERQAAILHAQAQAETARQTGAATADARKLAADAGVRRPRQKPTVCWPTARLEADARKLAAEALRAEQQAEADGLKAKLEAEATGNARSPTSLNAFSDQAVRMEILPAVLEGARRGDRQVGRANSATSTRSDHRRIVGGKVVAHRTARNLAADDRRVISTLEDSGIDVTGLVNGQGAAKSGGVVASGDARCGPTRWLREEEPQGDEPRNLVR